MSDNELAIVVLSIIFGSILGIIVVIKLFDLAKTWINRNKTSYDDETFDRLARAFIKHKKDSERRFQNLEALLTDSESAEISSSTEQRSEPESSRQIEIEEEPGNAGKTQEAKPGKLPNMLNKQRGS